MKKTKVILEYQVDRRDLKIVKVPNTYMECSVCGHWFPRESFCNAQGVQTRTNCEACYHLPSDEFSRICKETKQFYIDKAPEIQRLRDKRGKLGQSMTKKAFLKKINDELKSLKDTDLIYPFIETYDYDGMKSNNSLADISFTVTPTKIAVNGTETELFEVELFE